MALNLFSGAYPERQRPEPPSGTGAVSARTWPPVVGEFFVSQDHRNGPFAVSTLASIPLADALARIKPGHLCIVGKTETENIGIEKIIQNTISNPAIHFLILAGKDPEGHRSGATLLALCRKGVNAGMKVIGSPGRRPEFRNVSRGEVEAFRSQVKVVDMIGCQDVKKIISKMKKLASGFHRSCCHGEFSRLIKPLPA